MLSAFLDRAKPVPTGGSKPTDLSACELKGIVKTKTGQSGPRAQYKCGSNVWVIVTVRGENDTSISRRENGNTWAEAQKEKRATGNGKD